MSRNRWDVRPVREDYRQASELTEEQVAAFWNAWFVTHPEQEEAWRELFQDFRDAVKAKKPIVAVGVASGEMVAYRMVEQGHMHRLLFPFGAKFRATLGLA